MTTLTIVGLLAIMALVALADNHSKGQADMVQMAAIGKMAPDFKLMDAAGKAHTLSDYRGKFVVLEWVNFGCPFVKKHYNSGNMQMLQSTYAEKDVVWLSICSSAPGKQGYYDGKGLMSAIEDHEVKSSAYLIDADGEVGRMYQAKTTPNMYIINPKGVLIYSGAIDDKPSVKIEDVKGATNYVTAALDQAMAGKEVKVKTTQPYGCSVKYAGK
jgi:glutathione peroxidase-family protein